MPIELGLNMVACQCVPGKMRENDLTFPQPFGGDHKLGAESASKTTSIDLLKVTLVKGSKSE